MSSIGEMSCGHPLSWPQPWYGEGPWVPAQQHSSLSWHCLRQHGSLQPLGSFHIPPADAKQQEKVLSHGLLAHPPHSQIMRRRLPRAKPILARGVSLGGLELAFKPSGTQIPSGTPSWLLTGSKVWAPSWCVPKLSQQDAQITWEWEHLPVCGLFLSTAPAFTHAG